MPLVDLYGLQSAEASLYAKLHLLDFFKGEAVMDQSGTMSDAGCGWQKRDISKLSRQDARVGLWM